MAYYKDNCQAITCPNCGRMYSIRKFGITTIQDSYQEFICRNCNFTFKVTRHKLVSEKSFRKRCLEYSESKYL